MFFSVHAELTLHMGESLPLPIQVNSAWSRGDVAGAKWASFEAKRFNIYGLVCGSTFYGFIAVILLNILFWAN